MRDRRSDSTRGRHEDRRWAASPTSSSAGLRSVWPTGQDDVPAQFAGRGYDPAARSDCPLTPAIAEHAIRTLTRAGDLVLDPDCCVGTAVVEALRTGRHAIGLAGNRQSWRLARANVSTAKANGASMDGLVLVLDRRTGTIDAARAAGFTGHVDLLLTALHTPSGGLDDINAATERVGRLLAEGRSLVRPGGHLVVAVPPVRRADRPAELVDTAGRIHVAAVAAGLTPVARCVALTARVTSTPSGIRLSPWRTSRVHARAATQAIAQTGHPLARPAHTTMLIFKAAPATHAAAAALSVAPPVVETEVAQ